MILDFFINNKTFNLNLKPQFYFRTYFNVSFVSDSISYTFEVSIEKPVSGGHSYLNGIILSESFNLHDTIIPVNLNFSYLIE